MDIWRGGVGPVIDDGLAVGGAVAAADLAVALPDKGQNLGPEQVGDTDHIVKGNQAAGLIGKGLASVVDRPTGLHQLHGEVGKGGAQGLDPLLVGQVQGGGMGGIQRQKGDLGAAVQDALGGFGIPEYVGFGADVTLDIW